MLELAPDELPCTDLAAFVQELALRFNVRYEPTGLDAWAFKVSELAGDTPEVDATTDLLVALKRAHVISGAQLARLTHSYLKERATQNP